VTFLGRRGFAASAATGYILSLHDPGCPRPTGDIGTGPSRSAGQPVHRGLVTRLGVGAYAATAVVRPVRIRGLVVAPT